MMGIAASLMEFRGFAGLVGNTNNVHEFEDDANGNNSGDIGAGAVIRGEKRHHAAELF